jgi:hypothetical protein
LTLASLIVRNSFVAATTTRATCGSSSRALPVASNAPRGASTLVDFGSRQYTFYRDRFTIRTRRCRPLRLTYVTEYGKGLSSTQATSRTTVIRIPRRPVKL